MRNRQILTVSLSLLLGYLLASSLNRTSSGQPPAPQPAGQVAAVWRYQLTAPTDGGFKDLVILTDTATGHCWIRNNTTAGQWNDLGSPVDRK
ncbi:MAG: hypothetical protein ACLQIB_16710 [Isosphaeraceae bacterium]